MSPQDGRVVSNFIVQALQGEDLTVFGKGGQTRSFCYVDDLVDGLIRMMESEGGVTGPVNLGNPTENTIFELAEMILELTNSSSRLAYHDLPIDDPVQRQPDISMAREILGWNPSTPIKPGLIETIRYFRSLMNTQDTGSDTTEA